MKFKTITLLLGLSILTGVGCKQEGTSAESNGTSDSSIASPPTLKDQTQGCSVASVSGGAQITCGQTSAFVSNGSGLTPKYPRLFDGRSSGNTEAPEEQVGDYLISITKNNSAELITVWIEKENAILQYENGIAYPRDRAVFYNSNDCSGDGVYQTNLDVNSLAFGMSDRLIYWDRYYKLSSDVVHCYPRSKKEKDGSCTEITGPISGDFNGFIAKPADPGVTPALFSGYKVKVK